MAAGGTVAVAGAGKQAAHLLAVAMVLQNLQSVPAHHLITGEPVNVLSAFVPLGDLPVSCESYNGIRSGLHHNRELLEPYRLDRIFFDPVYNCRQKGRSFERPQSQQKITFQSIEPLLSFQRLFLPPTARIGCRAGFAVRTSAR